jgi:hypothetical protein
MPAHKLYTEHRIGSNVGFGRVKKWAFATAALNEGRYLTWVDTVEKGLAIIGEQ